MAKKTTGLEVKGGPVTAVEAAEEALGMTVAEAAATRGVGTAPGQVGMQTGPASKSAAAAEAVATRQAAMAASTGIQVSATINEDAATAAVEAATEGTTIEEVISLRETMVTEAMTTGYYDRLDERVGEQRIEYLYGFHHDENGLPSVHSPLWTALTDGGLENIINDNAEQILCRMTELTKTAASQAEVEATGLQADTYSYDMSAFDSLFVIENEFFEDIGSVSEIADRTGLSTDGQEFMIQESLAIELGVGYKEYIGFYHRGNDGVYRTGYEPGSMGAGTADSGAIDIPADATLESFTGIGGAISSVASQAAQSLTSATKNAAKAQVYFDRIASAAARRDTNISNLHSWLYSVTSDALLAEEDCNAAAVESCAESTGGASEQRRSGSQAVGGTGYGACLDAAAERCLEEYNATIIESQSAFNSSYADVITTYNNTIFDIFEEIKTDCESGYFDENLCSEITEAANQLVTEFA